MVYGGGCLPSHSLRILVATSLAACGGYPVVAAIDAGAIDAGGRDATGDAGRRDAGNADAGAIDAGVADARAVDAGNPGAVDAAPPNDDPPPAFTLGTSTLAGRAFPGDVDGARDVARFANPVNVAYRAGKVYVADFDNHKVRVIDAATHETMTLIARPGFERPFGLAFASDGTLYISTDNDQNGGHSAMTGSIWRVAPGGHTPELIAGSIGRPRGLAVLPDGRLAATDYVHHVVQLIDPATGAVSLLAGAWDQPGFVDDSGGAARFSAPYGAAVRGDGALVLAEFDNHRIRVVTLAGAVTTLTGGSAPGFQDGDLAGARFRRPQGLAIADNGDIFVTEIGNNRIRRITATGVSTVAGNGTAGYLDHDDPLASEMYGLEGLAVVPDGSKLYVADGGRGDLVPFNRVRQIIRSW
jgi:DNA-binding beta-propeller fold protein YncE